MNRRGFFGSVAGLVISAVCAPVLAQAACSKQESPILLLIKEQRRQAMQEMQDCIDEIEAEVWKPSGNLPRPSGIEYWIKPKEGAT